MARLRSTFFDRRSYGSLPSGDLESLDRAEAGAEGDAWFAQIQGGGPDVNPELSGSIKFDVYDEMALTDPTIKSLLFFHVLPVGSAVWGLNPKNDDPISMRIRDAAAWNFGLEGELGEMELSWSGLVRQIGTMALKQGNYIGEILVDDPRDWHDADGDAHRLLPFAAVSPRPARTIKNVNRERGRLVDITQTISGTKPMKADKVLYIVPDPRPGAWEGDSMLRSAWAAWISKKALQIASGIGWDRFASGLPVVYHPDDPDAEARARRIGQSVRQHQRGSVNFPASGSADQGGRPPSEWFMELLNGAATLGDPTPLLRWLCDQEIEAGLAHFAGVGRNDSGGARATSAVQVDPFFLAVQSLAELLKRDLSRQLLKRFVVVNFGLEAADRYMPTLTVSKIQARNVETISRALSLLNAAGFTFTDRGAVNDVRELLGFDTLPDEELAAAGIPRDKLLGILQGLGIDPATLAAIVNALPPEIGVARNVVPIEGGPLPLAAA